MVDIQSFGDKLKFARKNAGLKQSELSNMLGLANTTVSSWETNQSKPDINILENLCSILNVSPNFFFDSVKTDNKITAKDLEFIKKYNLLDDRAKLLVDNIISIEISYLKSKEDK